MRKQLYELVVELRYAKILLTSTEIESNHLQEVNQYAETLADERHTHVLSSLELVLTDLSSSIA